MKTHLFIAFFALANILAKAQNLYFPPTTGNVWDTISPQSLQWCQPGIDSLYSFLESNNTKAFILLKDGKIVLEKYFGTHGPNTPWYWASAGKTLTAFMVGIAQQEGFLAIADTTSRYLGHGWTACTPEQEAAITIRHQLTMTSGLDDGVADPYCTLDTCLIFKSNAGTRWAYHNGPYTLLDSVIVSATGTNLNTYVAQKLKAVTGINGTFLKIDYNNVFYSTARSMARFGLLILNRGNWAGTQIMTDTAYFRQMTNTSQSINLSYGYLWWLNGKAGYMLPQTQFKFTGSLSPNAPADMIAALGKNGQIINVVPSEGMVWIRMGNAPDNSLVSTLLNDQVWEHLNRLRCPTSEAQAQADLQEVVSIFPNPIDDELTIDAGLPFEKIEVIDLQGRVRMYAFANVGSARFSVDGLERGVYFLKIHFRNGQTQQKKLVKR
jgi:CubicO group peptidase (beta-lactamase class C family)